MCAVATSYPPARSFQPRRRGLPPARAERYARLVERWALTVEGGELPLAELFAGGDGGPLPVVLDIGFGGGEAVIEMAAARPCEAIIAIDVHTPGVANVLEAIDHHGWQHVRVVEGDVLELLPRLAPGSLAGIRLYFPDPWPKQKQRHRRLARADVIPQLVERLCPGGTLHIATDIADYATQAARLCAEDARLRGGVVPRPEWRPVTRFERRGLAAGRVATDLLYERVG